MDLGNYSSTLESLESFVKNHEVFFCVSPTVLIRLVCCFLEGGAQGGGGGAGGHSNIFMLSLYSFKVHRLPL